jgi:dipeptidase
MKNVATHKLILVLLAMMLVSQAAVPCTNFLITRGASTDGSTMISYAADSHVLYGELYFWPAADHPVPSYVDIYEWDTGKKLGQIQQVPHTYQVVGNMNEHQVAIGETTFTGLESLGSQPGAVMDYGSLMYIALQRSANAREAIQVITDLVAEYGYYSTGESFSISDKEEVWILEMIGKGAGALGAVWVARMVPDGFVSGHANQARITTFPQTYSKGAISSADMDKLHDPSVHTVYADDVISFARQKGLYKGTDAAFSFSDTYAPLDFGAARFCEARVWSMFRKVAPDMDDYLDHVMGHDLENRLPLWVKPTHKVSLEDMMSFMRDHFEGTPLDMTKDYGAGPFEVPYRWRPLTWEVDGVAYCNERAVATQQTGFSFVAQSRNWYPDPVGGILWWGLDDAATTVYAPLFCGMEAVPPSVREGYGSLLEFEEDAGFWVFNQVANLAYTRYSYIYPEIEREQQELEGKFIASNEAISEAAAKLYATNSRLGIEFVTDYSVDQMENTISAWKLLYQYLFAKFVDGNIKKTDGRRFVDNGEGRDIPVMPDQPGYSEAWYRKVQENRGDHFRVVDSE